MSNKIIYLLILLTDVHMGVIINTMNRNIAILFLQTIKVKKNELDIYRKSGKILYLFEFYNKQIQLFKE